MPALAHQPGRDARLPTIGAAPPFALTTADSQRLALADLRGKVVAVTFVYATCTDTCPLLTAKLAALGKRLGKDFGAKVAFVAITVDPERDTPDVLRGYAQAHGARGAGWTFLTGTPAEIKDVARRYGVFARKTDRGDVDHTFLTSLVDRDGRFLTMNKAFRQAGGIPGEDMPAYPGDLVVKEDKAAVADAVRV